MPVPTTFHDFSAVAANNYPQGNETIGSSLDDYMRGYQACLKLGLGHIVSVKDYGAVGDGSTDDTTAFSNAITAASGKTLYIPDPASYYKITSALSIPANTRIEGQNKATTKIQRAFAGTQLMTLADSASLHNLYLEGDGATYAGKGLVIAGTDSKQNITNCRIINFDGNCIEFSATTAGSQSNFDNVETWQTNGTTGSGKYAIVNADAAQVAAIPKSFKHIETAGKCAFDFGGSADVFISNSFLADLNYSANSTGVIVTNTRIANQVALTISGSNNVIVGCDILPSITLAAGSTSCVIGPNSYNTLTFTDSSASTTNMLTHPSVSYTPTWTGSVVNPVLNNGVLVGNYGRAGDKITLQIDLTMGSTTTFGTGVYSFSVPVVPRVSGVQIGTAYLVDSGTTLALAVVVLAQNASTVFMFTSGSLTQVGTAAPWTWAQNDTIRMHIEYMV